MDYELQTLETEHQRGWQLDGQVELHNPHIGTTVTYGMRPEGYDGVVIHERRGGGAVTVPYVVEEGEPYIGLLHEERQLMGGMVWNVPRGMLQPDETHEEGALREFHEETGYLAVGRTVDLLAMEVNSNSAVFDTSREGEGIRFYGVRFQPRELVFDEQSELFRFPPEVQPLDMTKFGERITKVEFRHWEEAAQSPDMFTIAAVGLIQARAALTSARRFAGMRRVEATLPR